jgi:hypothetical protein
MTTYRTNHLAGPPVPLTVFVYFKYKAKADALAYLTQEYENMKER